MSGVSKWIGGYVVLGVVAGFGWLLSANPAEWEVTTDGIILTEEGSKGRFGVIVTFVVISAVASLLWGLVAGFRLRSRGWILVPVFALTAVAAGLIAWQVGAVFGPPDPASVRGTSVGDRLPQQLAIDTISPFLVWPIFTLVGLFLAVYSTGDGSPKGARHSGEVLRG